MKTNLPAALRAVFTRNAVRLMLFMALIACANFLQAAPFKYRGHASRPIKKYTPSIKKSGAVASPTVSYPTPKIYNAGKTISALTPTSANVAAPGYSSITTTIGSGFVYPAGMAVDAAGNVYVADQGASVVYEITNGTGSVIPIGSGFASPLDVAVDGSGNVYVADWANNAVKKIKPDGSLVTLGNFNQPYAVTVDGAGNVYVAEYGSGDIKELVAGNPTPVIFGNAIIYANALAVDASGNVYAADSENNVIQKIPANGGAEVTVASGFYDISGVAVSATGDLYVSDAGNNTLQEFPAAGGTAIPIGIGSGDIAGVAVGGAGVVYFSDDGNLVVKAVTPTGGYYVNALPPGLTFNTATGTFNGTPGKAKSATDYIVTAYNASGTTSATVNITVNALSITYTSPVTLRTGKTITPLSPTISSVSPMAYSNRISVIDSSSANTQGLAADAFGNIYVADFANNVVREIPVGGGPSITLGSGLNQPYAVAVDAAGNIYIACFDGSIKKIQASDGATITINSSFGTPVGIAVDASGNVYVSDNKNQTISQIAYGSGAITTLANGYQNLGDVAVDANNNVYFTDSNTHALYEIFSGGNIIQLYSYFGNPLGICVDGANNIFITDAKNDQLDEILAGTGILRMVVSGTDDLPKGICVDGFGNIFFDFDNMNKPVCKIKPVGGYYINGLPPGLSFSNNTGVISGTTVNDAPAKNYTVTAYNGYGGNSALVNITITSAISLSYTNPPAYTVGKAITPLAPASSGVDPPGYTNFGNLSSINTPVNIAVDVSGNIFIADSQDGRIYKRGTDGSLTIFASGFSSGLLGLATDAQGNVYVSSQTSSVVQEIPAAGGTPVSLGSGFSSPYGLAVDAAGNVYVADNGNNAVKKIPAGNGTVVTLSTAFNSPIRLALDPAGNIYVMDNSSAPLKKIPAGGGAPVAIGSGLTGTGSIAIDGGGNIFVTDITNNLLKEIPSGSNTASTIESDFNYPSGVAVDGSGNLYVTSLNGPLVSKYVLVGGYNINALPAGLIFNNTTGVISGTPVKATPATSYTVTAYNNLRTATETVNLSVTTTASASLSALTISNGTLSPAFSSTTTTYSASVGYGLTTMTVTPTAADPAATIKVQGQTVASGAASQHLTLSPGTNAIPIVVTRSDGVTTKTYTLTVTEAHSSNNNLSALTVGGATLSPTFAAATTSYTGTVAYTVSSTTITPTTADPTATVKVNGNTVTSGSASASIPLSVGANTITVIVTAQNSATKTYTITVTRSAASTNAGLSNIVLSKGTLSPTFATATLSYTAMETNGTASVTVTPTAADATATIKVNGTVVTSGKASTAITLAVGSNIVTTVVTAQDGSTTKTYTVNVIRPSTNAKLAALTISSGTLTPAFNTNTTSYTDAVTNATSSVTITPTIAVTGATIKVNGTVVTSGTPSAAVALSVGGNTITTVVTAQDGVTTDTYTITVTRAASGANIPDEAAGVTVGVQNFEPLRADDGVNVHQGISPNGDGIDDFLQIDNITNYPDNHLSIMNRNGQLVYEAKGYDNATKVFEGHSNKTGQMQLPGTYFYSLDYTVNGVVKHKTGFLVLKY